MPAAGAAFGRSPRPAPGGLQPLLARVPGAEAGAGLVAPVAGVDPAVDARLVDEGVHVRRGARLGRPVRATPAVAGRVDQHADAGREAVADQLVAEGLGERELVHVLVPVDPLALPDAGAVDRGVDGEVGLGQRGVVRRVGDEAGDVVDAAGGDRGLVHQVGGGLEVRAPADPAVVRGVQVVVDVADRAQLLQRVGDAVDVPAVGLHRVAHRGRAGLATGVGDQVRQRVDLDDVDDAQVLVLGVALDRGDRVDVLRLVPRQVVRPELTVGGQRGAVPAGQVVDDQLDVAGALGDRGVQVGGEAHRPVGAGAGGAGDRGDPVQPDGGRGVGDAAAAGLGVGLGLPLRVHVALDARVRVVDLVTRRGAGRAG